LFNDPQPDAGGKEFLHALNPDSSKVVRAFLESGASGIPGTRYQFERFGYFMADALDSCEAQPVFNRITTLRDSWGK
jgi:glutaminyl-tRNA synthetase